MRGLSSSYHRAVTNQPDAALAKVFETISAKDLQHRDAIVASETNSSKVIELIVDRWQRWWQSPGAAASRLEVVVKLDNKFRLCFPLAAHALNHVEAAWNLRTSLPWMAKSGARVAFEHALTAQWVLLTEGGEAQLKTQLDRDAFVRREMYVDSVRKLSQLDDTFTQAHGLTDADLTSLIGERPEGGRRRFEAICRRFANTDMANLFYDIFRDLSEAVHPSYGLIQSHLTFDPGWVANGVNWRGTSGNEGELIRALAVSSLWALYALEVCRDGQPHALEVIEIGHRAGLPVDLRFSDQQPELQPVDHRYWH